MSTGSTYQVKPMSRIQTKVLLYSFLFILYSAYRIYYWKDSLPEQWDAVSLNVLVDLLLIYFLNTVQQSLPARFFDKRWLMALSWFILSMIGSVILIGLHWLAYELADAWTENFRKVFQLAAFQVFDTIVVVMIGFSLSTAFLLINRWNEARVSLEQMEKEKVLSEINYLKSQINPHFVFNTLNSIYFLIKDDNDPARDALQTFSEMLRYQLYDSSANRVPVSDELSYIQAYFDLQKLRLDESYDLRLQIDDQVEGFEIAPLLLIIPIENAFKYLSHSLEHNFVHIGLSYESDRFQASITNSTEGKTESDRPGGIGLSNLNRRLELLYPEAHDLDITEAPGLFTVKLSLQV